MVRRSHTDLLDQFHTVSLWLILVVILDGVPRVFLEIYLDPNEHPSLGLVDACIARGSDLGVKETKQKVPPPLIFPREAPHPLGEAVESPTFLSQKFCEEELTKTCRLLSRVVGEFNEVPVEERGTCDGPEAHSRS